MSSYSSAARREGLQSDDSLSEWKAPDNRNQAEIGGVNIKMNLKNADTQYDLNSRQMNADQAVMQLAKDYTKACGANGANFTDDVVLQAYKHINLIANNWDNNKKGLLVSVFESGLRRAGVNVESVKQVLSKESKLSELKNQRNSGAEVTRITQVQERIRSMQSVPPTDNMLRLVEDDDWVQKAKSSTVVPIRQTPPSPPPSKPGFFKRLFGRE